MKQNIIKLFSFLLCCCLLPVLQTVAEEDAYVRTVCKFDFQNDMIGNPPAGLLDYSVTADGEDITVEKDMTEGAAEENQILRLRGEKNAADPAFCLDRSYEGDLRIDFKIYFSDASMTSQIMFKDLVSNQFIAFLKQNGKTLNFLNKDVAGFEWQAEKWYSVSVNLNSATDVAVLTIDGVRYAEGSILFNTQKLNYEKLSFRIQPRNNSTSGKILDVFVDDLNVMGAGMPEITLLGDSRIVLKAGKRYSPKELEPGYSAADPFDGDITGKIVKNKDFTEAVDGEMVYIDTPGTYQVQYDVTTSDGFKAETKYREIVVKEENLLENAVLSAANAKEGYEPAHLNDEDEHTAWRPGEEYTASDFTIDFQQDIVLDRLVLIEEPKNIKAYTLEASADGKAWSALQTKETQTEFDRSISFDPVAARYMRVNITDADISDGVGISVCEAEGYVQDQSVAEVDASLLELGITGVTVTSDLILKSEGKYGSRIAWKSSQPDVVLNNGTVIRPVNDTVVTLTATVSFQNGSVLKSFPSFTVPKKETHSGGGNGGGGRPSGGLTIVDTPTATPTPTASPSASPTPSPAAVSFTDVPADHWAYTYIEEMAAGGIINGTSEHTFEPDRTITREEFLKLLLEGLGLSGASEESGFADVDPKAWYAPFVARAKQLGIADGINGQLFGIGQGISRQDMAVMAVRAAEAAGIDLKEVQPLTEFSDQQQIAGYAREYVDILQGAGLLSGNNDGSFAPEGLLTRAQAAKVVYLLIKE